MGSNIETYQDTFSQIIDDKTYNRGGNNNSGGDNKGLNNANNINGGGNNISISGNFGSSARRLGSFSYMNTSRVATTKVHDVNHVTNPTQPDNMACTESYSHSDTTFAVKNMTLFHTLFINSMIMNYQWRISQCPRK